MGYQAVEEILASRNLIGRVTDVVNGVPDDVIPTGFTTATRTTEGNRGEYLRTKGTRQAATINRYGAPAKHAVKAGIGSTPVTLLHAFEDISHDPNVLQLLISEDGNGLMRQQMAKDTINRQLDVFGTRFRNLRMSAIYSALATGGIAFDEDGNLLPPGADAGNGFSINFGVPSDHAGTAGGILTNWLTAGVDIIGQIKKIKKKGRKDTGFPLRYAFYGEDVAGILLNTDQFKTMARGSSKLAEEFATSEIPSSFGGLEWIPVEQAFFDDQNGVSHDWFGTKDIVFTPDPAATVRAGTTGEEEIIASGWWEVIEGTFAVPRSIQLAADLSAVLGNIQMVAGPFSYAQITTNPVTLQHFAGDTMLPILKNGAAIFTLTVPTA